MWWFVVIFVVIQLIYKLLQQYKIDYKDKVVLITGCDTGIGHMTAQQLSNLGCKVLAGCLSEDGIRRFSAVANVIPFQLDLSNQESIEDCYQLIAANCPNGLWAIINNAGIYRWSLMEITPMESYRHLMEVNFYGHISLTKQCLPLLKKSKGRIINMTSAADVISFSSLSAYCASKCAFRGWNDSVRLEMKPWGIKVCLIEPGAHKTPANDLHFLLNNVNVIKASLPKHELDNYGDDWFEQFKNSMKIISETGDDPQRVVDCYIHAAFSYLPKAYYRVGYDALLWWSMSILPAWLHIHLVKPILPNTFGATLKHNLMECLPQIFRKKPNAA